MLGFNHKNSAFNFLRMQNYVPKNFVDISLSWHFIILFLHSLANTCGHLFLTYLFSVWGVSCV